jgi:hypothetical protein
MGSEVMELPITIHVNSGVLCGGTVTMLHLNPCFELAVTLSEEIHMVIHRQVIELAIPRLLQVSFEDILTRHVLWGVSLIRDLLRLRH